MSKPVEVEFLMKDKLTPGMNKAEREALELRNTVRLLEAELERLRLAGETAAPNLDQSANIAQIHALEKQLEEMGFAGKLKFLLEDHVYGEKSLLKILSIEASPRNMLDRLMKMLQVNNSND